MASLLTRSATALAASIRSREVTSREVVEAHIARTEQVNPVLNAMVADRFALARREADRADALLANGDPAALPPFHGVPCSIKECFALEGMPQTAGLVARRGVVADGDATAVARMRAAGFIPLGVTNLSELCMWMESNNRVYGRTGSAYDPKRTAGGSSGGEGSLVGAGGTPVGLGSDIGGSIRMPAFFNGVFGHKPSGGLVPGSGQYPMAEGAARRYLSTGPLARRAEDLYPLLRLLAGPDGLDGGCERISLPDLDPCTLPMAGLRVMVVEDNGAITVDPRLRQAQARAAEALGRRGAQVEGIRIARLSRSFEIWSAMLSAAGGASFSELLGNGRPVALLGGFARLLLGRSPHTLPALALALLEKLPHLLGARATSAIEEGARLKQEMADLLGPRGVLLYPPYPALAPLHNRPLLAPLSWVYTAIFNVLELPVTQVPLGLSAAAADHGPLPLGVQVVGAHGNDPLTIAVALALEEDLGGWVAPPGLPALA